jgi:Predicted nucleotide-binding protein containing TIR-like domain
MKIRAFIGSSSEQLELAKSIKKQLQPELACTVWNDKKFQRLSKTFLSSISEQLEDFDVGIFVFGADDRVVSRRKHLFATRDNVIFEHGLFCGCHGAEHTFVVRPKNAKLKWLSDLEGFSAAQFDPDRAEINAQQALRDACQQIKKACRHIVPKTGLYYGGKRFPIGSDWWTYSLSVAADLVAKGQAGTLTSSHVSDAEGFNFVSPAEIGVMRPRKDNLNQSSRVCAFRIKAIQSGSDRRFYIAVKAKGEQAYLAFSDAHPRAGWGTPANEFKIPLPHLDDGEWHRAWIDLSRFAPYLGDPIIVNGFRLRPGLRVSHLALLDDRPAWFADSDEIRPIGAPLVKIQQPRSDATVDHEESVEVQVDGATSLQALVLAPDGIWYPQPDVTREPGGSWRARCYFGNKNYRGDLPFKLAVLTGENRAVAPSKELPSAEGRDIISVRRKRRRKIRRPGTR